MAAAVLNEIRKRVKTDKCYAIILDFTPDMNQQEQCLERSGMCLMITSLL